MLKQDLTDLYTQFIDCDDITPKEVNDAIATYAEENDLHFTEVLEELYQEYRESKWLNK